MSTTAILATLMCDGNPVATSTPSATDPNITIIPIGGGSSVYFSVTWPDEFGYSTSIYITGNVTASGPSYAYTMPLTQALYPPTFAYATPSVC